MESPPSSVNGAGAAYSARDAVKHMISGAVAGTVEHVAMFPVDTIKTRMQALGHPGQRLHNLPVLEALRSALRREGVLGLYRGVGAVAAGAGPAHALYFAVYEACKTFLGGDEGEASAVLLRSAVAGSLATCVNEGLMTPADMVKQRLQMSHSPYHGVVDCIRKTFASEGLGAFYRSYPTTLVMTVPFTAIYFSMYEGSKRLIMEAEDTEDRLMVQLLAGGAAGGLAAAVTTPLDVVKTRLQTEGVASATRYGSSSVLQVMRVIWAREGGSALWRGVVPRVMFHMPAAAVCWGTYETMKRLLHMKDDGHHGMI